MRSYTFDGDPSKLDQQIRDAEEKLNQLRNQRQRIDQLSAEQRLADYIHGRMCHADHTDQCGYYYDDWIPGVPETRYTRENNANGIERMRWYEKAHALLRDFRYDLCVQVVDILSK